MSQVRLDLEASNASTGRPQYAQFDVSWLESQQRVLFRVELKKGQDDWIVAKCLDVKGAFSQGKSVDEALKNIIEAISLILEDAFGEAPPFSVTWVEK